MTAAPTPHEAQQRASHPYRSAWVQAHAGSGKTKMLVDRVVRILLEGIDPSHIVCITYTKAAATEMHLRILARLRAWVKMDESALSTHLCDLQGTQSITPSMLATARQLYLRVLDAPMGLRIHTIHALCEQILAQFPNEAGIAPHIRIMEEQEARHYLQRAVTTMMRHAHDHPTGALYDAIHTIMEGNVSAYSFSQMMQLCIQHRRTMEKQLATEEGLHTAIIHLYEAAELPRDIPISTYIAELLAWDASMHRTLCEHMRIIHTHGGSTAQKAAQHFFAWLEAHPENSPITLAAWNALVRIPLTEKNTIRQNLLTKPLRKDHCTTTEWLDSFFEQCLHIHQLIARAGRTVLSNAIMICASALYQHYQQMKASESCIDFDDLILLTRTLLEETHDAAWVIHKLDGNITHLLIDEAQDTSEDQWAITQYLCEGMFQKGGQHQHSQHLFVVGDSKQSIYSFQGADPHAFLAKRSWYQQLANAMEHPWEDVPLATSFRSTQAILDVVDAFCTSTHHDEAPHHAFRTQQAGSVTLYPLITTADHSTLHHRDALAQMIADQVAHWLHSGRINPATGLAFTAGDILILVQQRNRTLYALDRALRTHNIPTAGLDRMDSSHLAIRDMIALLQWLCDARDDAALAALLRSPLYALDDDALCALCAPRTSTVWAALHDDATYASIVEELSTLRHKMEQGATPLALLYHLLYARAGMARMIARMGSIARDVLEHMLYALERYEAQETVTIYGCVAWMQDQEGSTKRDLDDAHDALRIMTVHGSKGLEAPLVIIADMIGKEYGARTPALVVHHHHDTPLLLSMGQADDRHGVFADADAAYRAQQEAESQRLLYVALTRARDELHMFGSTRPNLDKVSTHSWYAQIQRIMETMEGTRRHALPIQEHAPYRALGEAYTYSTGTCAPMADAHHHTTPSSLGAPPSWMITPTMHTPSMIAWHAPSDDTTTTDAQTSLFYENSVQAHEASDARAFGTILHHCLQKQTGMNYDDFLQALPHFLVHLAPHWNESDRTTMMDALRALGTDRTIRAMLEAPAHSEWGIMGKIDGIHYSGVMDRVIMLPDAWIILEIKTGMMPKAESPRFRAHCQQVKIYHTLMQQACATTHPIRCALLYTQQGLWVDL